MEVLWRGRKVIKKGGQKKPSVHGAVGRIANIDLLREEQAPIAQLNLSYTMRKISLRNGHLSLHS